MKLHQLFYDIDLLLKSKKLPLREDFLNRDMSGIYFDARSVVPDSIFVAVTGTKTDGHQYIQQAIENGAIGLVVEKIDLVPNYFQGAVYLAKNSREVLDVIASRFYHNPSEKLFMFGVTGTNGKTSITYLLEHILNSSNKRVGVMGTVNHRIGDHIWESQMTTPDPVTLQLRLKDFLEYKAYAAALEVSSHALDQNRVDSVHFNTVIYTNLTLDHLDYHQTMQNYFEAKQKLFTDLLWKSKKNILFAIVNIDDSYGRRLKICDRAVVWTYGQGESDFQFKILSMSFAETVFELNTPLEKVEIKICVPGVHTVYNVVASIAAAITAGVTLKQAISALQDFVGIPGRLEKVKTDKNRNIFVDYAHTPDALLNSLKSIRKIQEEMNITSKVITVFGCGGDRDKSKRPLMGQIACELSDEVIVTSDNPRSEEPEQIIKDILTGVPENFKNVSSEIDREKAIRKAIAIAKDNDVILIAGKGHENYQIIKGIKYDFSDVNVAQKILEEK